MYINVHVLKPAMGVASVWKEYGADDKLPYWLQILTHFTQMMRCAGHIFSHVLAEPSYRPMFGDLYQNAKKCRSSRGVSRLPQSRSSLAARTTTFPGLYRLALVSPVTSLCFIRDRAAALFIWQRRDACSPVPFSNAVLQFFSNIAQ